MTIEIEAPDGSIVEFPDGTDDLTISRVMEQNFGYQEGVGGSAPTIPGTQQDARRMQAIERTKLNAKRKRDAWLSSRGPVERFGDAAAFVGSMPVRMFTQGEYGLGDVASAVGAEGAAASINNAERDFHKANPELIRAMGAAGEVAAGIPALNTMAPGLRPYAGIRTHLNDLRAANTLNDLAAFQRSGVDRFSPAFMNESARSMAKGLSDVSIVGAPVKNSLENSLSGAAVRSRQVSERFGSALPPDQSARLAQQGLERYKSERTGAPSGQFSAQQRSATLRAPSAQTSIKTKQDAIYDKAWSFIPASMREGRAVQGLPRLMVRFDRARNLLNEIQSRNSRMTVQSGASNAGAAPVVETGGFTRNVIEALQNQRYSASLQTARDIRSRFRRIVSGLPENERNALSRADIKRIESALTQDIIGSLEQFQGSLSSRPNVARNIGRAISTFKRADQFTRAAANRIDDAKRLFDAPDEVSLWRSIVNAGVQGDVPKLHILRRVLRRQEMDEISSSLINELGRPVGSARGIAEDLGFSVSSFTTRWNKMVESNPRTLEMMFPNREHRQALTDLVRVANRLANVESMANTSRSATQGANLGLLGASGAAYATASIEGLLGSLAAMGTASLVLSRPELAGWVGTYMRLRAAAARNPASNPQLRDHIARLGPLAARAGIEGVVDAVENDNANLLSVGRFAEPRLGDQ